MAHKKDKRQSKKKLEKTKKQGTRSEKSKETLPEKKAGTNSMKKAESGTDKTVKEAKVQEKNKSVEPEEAPNQRESAVPAQSALPEQEPGGTEENVQENAMQTGPVKQDSLSVPDLGFGEEKGIRQLFEERLKVIEDKLMEINDLQIVNKLDIINMKSMIDGIKMNRFQPVGQAGETRTPAEHGGIERRIKELGKRLESLEKKPIPPPPLPAMQGRGRTPASQLERIGMLENKLAALSERISGLKPVKIPEGVKDIESYSSAVDELRSEIKSLRSQQESGKGPAPEDTEHIKRKTEQCVESIKNVMEYVRANQERIEGIKEKTSKNTGNGDVEKLSQKIKELSEKVASIEERPFVPKPGDSSGMGRILGKMHEIEKGMEGLEKTLEKEKTENIATQAHASKLFAEVKKNRENIERIESTSSSSGIRDVYKSMEKLKDSVSEAIERQKERDERIENELNAMRKEAEQMKMLKERIDKMDVDELSRKVESAVEKSRWLEEGMERLDLKPLYDRIEEIEHKLKQLKVSSPFVIE